MNSKEEVQQAFIQFYASLFGSTQEHRCPVNPSIMDKGVRLTDAHMDCKFNMDDIKKALMDIPNNKAPGLDGYHSFFFKTAWLMVQNDFCAAIFDFFTTGKILKEVNVTSITIVSKVHVPASVGDYISNTRPLK